MAREKIQRMRPVDMGEPPAAISPPIERRHHYRIECAKCGGDAAPVDAHGNYIQPPEKIQWMWGICARCAAEEKKPPKPTVIATEISVKGRPPIDSDNWREARAKAHSGG